MTLHTNKDYCIGSSIIATSPHALQKIVWYHNGQAVSSATGDQSLATTPLTFNVLPDSLANATAFSDIGTDGAGHIYLADSGPQQVIQWTPASGHVQIIPGPYLPLDFVSIFVDQPGNVYVLSSDSGSIELTNRLVEEFVAGSLDSMTAIAKPIGKVYTYGQARSLFVDCQHNIYIGTLEETITKWGPGATSGDLVATPGDGASNCVASGGNGRVRVDSAGNIFFIVGSGVQKLARGASVAHYVTESDCVGSASKQITDFWMDGKDTIYEDGFDAADGKVFVEKWAPGASSGQIIASFTFPSTEYGRIPFTMDIKGNFYFASEGNNHVVELSRKSAIDSAFTPADTGAYYAVVTDIQGYTTTSDVFHVNAPNTGPPSIQISATATSTPVCTPITFTAQIVNPGSDPAFQWQVSGVPAGGDSTTYSYNLFANGDRVYCILAAQAGCAGPVQDTSNIITLTIDPHGTASVSISTPKDSICRGDTAIFAAKVTGGSNQPVFAWLVDGDSTSDNTAIFNGSQLSTGDVVTCLITSDDACGLAKSNSIPLTVSIPPTIESGQIFTILHGHSLTLEPVTSGDIDSWRWTPATGLSDTTIADPVAGPDANTLYTLIVTAPGGCTASGTILVNVYTPLSIPGAFTPNGDGHNDDFYVLGGPVNSEVEDFAVFNRFGAEIFHAHDVAPGDKTYAWNGSFRGTPAPAGTYVYVVVMKLAGGVREVYKGTVVLIR